MKQETLIDLENITPVPPPPDAPAPDPAASDASTSQQVPVYIVSASLISPDGWLAGKLEAPWRGAATIGELCNTLITTSKERPDLDQCRISVRWRK